MKCGEVVARNAQTVFNATRKYNLPKLDITCAKRASAGVEIIAEHTFEAFVIIGRNFWPGIDKALVPRHQSRVIVGAKVMPVFHYKV